MAFAPPSDPNQDRTFTFVVKVDSFGSGDETHISQIETVLWKHLNHGFGADRVQVWHEGERQYFDPVADAQLP